jgi:hypothetical protein
MQAHQAGVSTGATSAARLNVSVLFIHYRPHPFAGHWRSFSRSKGVSACSASLTQSRAKPSNSFEDDMGGPSHNVPFAQIMPIKAAGSLPMRHRPKFATGAVVLSCACERAFLGANPMTRVMNCEQARSRNSPIRSIRVSAGCKWRRRKKMARTREAAKNAKNRERSEPRHLPYR